MSDHTGESITVFGCFIRLQRKWKIIRREPGLNYLFRWLGCTCVWLINEDELGFSMDRDAGFFFTRDSQTVQLLVKKLVLLRDPDPFLRLQCQNTKNEHAVSQHHESRGVLFLVEFNCKGMSFFFLLLVFHLPMDGHT